MRFFPSGRLARFFLIHAIICIAVCAFAFSRHPAAAPVFVPYAIAFVQTYLGSFAGALLSIVQMIMGAFKSFAGVSAIEITGHPVPFPVMAGGASLLGYLLVIASTRMFTSKTTYVVYILCSCLILYGSFIYFSTDNNKAMSSHPIFVQPGR